MIGRVAPCLSITHSTTGARTPGSSAFVSAYELGGVINLVSRRPTKEPIHEALINQSTAGATDGALFLAGSLGKQWGASLLAGANFQTKHDFDDDGW